jgi:cobalamin biosynthetic protein CobC
LAIGAAALRDQAWAERTRRQLSSDAGALDAVLRRAGLEVVGGTSLYRLARHNSARAVHEALARQRVWCRCFDWADDLLRFGLPADVGGRDRLATALGVALEGIDGHANASTPPSEILLRSRR